MKVKKWLNFVEIKFSSLDIKNNDENKLKQNVDNYKYKEIKVQGPENNKPIMKLRKGLNGENFYEKFIPEKKIIKYIYEPVCKFINNENVNNIGFKKVVSSQLFGQRKMKAKIKPYLLTNSKDNKIINNVNFSYNSTSNVIKEKTMLNKKIVL